MKFYEKLYSQHQVDNDLQIETFLNSLHLPTVTETQNNILRADVTREEINLAISRLKAGSSPGADGFTAEWYRVLRDKLAPMLLRVYNWVLKKSEMPPSWREALVSLIPKEGKNRQECDNLRPISVLNVDYRLFTSVMARRLEKCLPDLIHLDQTGFIKQRQTQDNIRRLLHIIRHVTENKIESALISLDAQKAFDTVSWKFLYKVLYKLGFHEDFIKIIQTLYDKPTARIKVNGNLSPPFILQRGCRQGCAVSPLLFAIFIEPLSQWIRQNQDIKGISTIAGEQKLALFADDILIYLEQPTQSLPILMSCLEEYGVMSGYKLNVSKTQVLAFNYEPTRDIIQKYQLKWDADSIKYLGVYLPKELGNLFNINFGPLNSKLKADVGRWNVIPFLNLGSRVESVKMNILPRLLYLFQTLPVEVPTQQFVEWDKLISRYIWNGRKPRIKYKTLQLRKEYGGMGLPCMLEYYYAAQLRPLICWCDPEYKARWKELELAMANRVPLQAIISDVTLVNQLSDKENPFINLSLKIWKEVQKICNIQKTAKLLRWCAFDTEFPPNLNDKRFNMWIRRGVTAYCTLIHKGALKSFQNMKEEYNLEQQDFFRFLQMRHYLKTVLKDVDMGNLEEGMMNLFISAYKSKSNTKIISRTYKCLSNIRSGDAYYIKEKWDRESNKALTGEEWHKICQIQWKTTSSLGWREFCWKCLTRFFITPLQKRHRSSNSECWRQCQINNADHYHIFWSCPILNTYWKNVHQTLKEVFKTTIPFRFDVLYLCNIPQEISSKDRILMTILLAACKKAITRKWLKPQTPQLEDWIEIIHQIYLMEKLTYSLRLHQEKFTNIWSRWVDFIKPLRQDFT